MTISLPQPLARFLSAVALALLVGAVAFSHGFSPIGDENDIWWHLKTGKAIAQRGGFPPAHDIFAYTSERLEWHNHEWLAELLMYGVYQRFESGSLGGLRAVILAKALMLAAAFLIVMRLTALRAGDATSAALVVVVAVSISRFSLKARPPIITYVLLALFLLLLYGAYRRRDQRLGRWIRLAAMPPLMVLWANLHGGFLAGLVVVALFAVGSFIDGLVAWLGGGRKERLWSMEPVRMACEFTYCAVGCFVATLINPFGFALYGMFFRVMTDPVARSIAELQPPPLIYARGFEVMILAFIVIGSLARKRLPTATDYLILLFFLHQALHHVRHLPLFAITAAPILGWQIRALYDDLPEGGRRLWRPLMAALACAASLFLVAFPRAGQPTPRLRANAQMLRGEVYQPIGFPEEVCDFLLSEDLPGRMFNEINFAGYLIWRLSPEKYRVFTDSRFDIFGGTFKRMADVIQGGVENGPNGISWRRLLDHWDINLVVIDRHKFLNHRLRASGQWTLAFRDSRDYFRLWTRNEPRKPRKFRSAD